MTSPSSVVIVDLISNVPASRQYVLPPVCEAMTLRSDRPDRTRTPRQPLFDSSLRENRSDSLDLDSRTRASAKPSRCGEHGLVGFTRSADIDEPNESAASHPSSLVVETEETSAHTEGSTSKIVSSQLAYASTARRYHGVEDEMIMKDQRIPLDRRSFTLREQSRRISRSLLRVFVPEGFCRLCDV